MRLQGEHSFTTNRIGGHHLQPLRWFRAFVSHYLKFIMVEFKKNVGLSQFSNYKIGGPAKFFFEARNDTEVREAVSMAKGMGLDIFILGGGTNLLINDSGFNGLVLKPNLNFLERRGWTINAGAGAQIPDLLDFTSAGGLSGLEWAGGLPGTLGGAIRGNAGAFGGETKDVVSTVRSFDTKTFRIINRKNSECNFSYRSSVFKENHDKEIILSAELSLKKGDPAEIAKTIREKINYRLKKHPLEHPNIGSIFKNVDLKKVPPDVLPRVKYKVKIDPFPVVPAVFLISEAGLKGISRGGAMISPKHPNFIVNVLGAEASDVKKLIALVKKEVNKKFKIKLDQEVMEV